MDPLIGYIVTATMSLTVGLLLQKFADKPNLKYFLPGTFLFEINDPKIKLRTDSLTIQNFGKKTATNIEIVHKKKPDHFQFSQAISYQEKLNPNGEHLTQIASLGPKEFINIQYLSHVQSPILLNVRSDHGTARLIQVQFQQIFSKWMQAIVGILMLIGFGFLLFWIIKAAYYFGLILNII